MEKEKQAAENKENASIEERLKKIHKLANQPMKCSIDEVAAAYFQSLRVENYEILGEEFGGYKVGRIYLFVLDLLSKHIDDTMNAGQMFDDKNHALERYKQATEEIEQIIQTVVFDPSDKSINRHLINYLQKINIIIKKVKEEKQWRQKF